MTAHGAYGLRIDGLSASHGLLGPALPHWPAVRVVTELGRLDAGARSWFDDEGAGAVLPGERSIVMSRADARAVVTAPHPLPVDELVHPGLSPVAACFGAWAGYEAFHGAAFAVGGRAWGLFADKEGGKSSTVGWLHRRGCGVLTDDLVMVAGQRLLSGPRCVDLRDEAAAVLGGRPLGGERRGKWRIDLPAVEPDYPLGGWVVLRWGDDVQLRPLPTGDRLAALARCRVWDRLPPQPSVWLDLAALPAWELSRPRSWSSLEGSVSVLCDTLRSI